MLRVLNETLSEGDIVAIGLRADFLAELDAPFSDRPTFARCGYLGCVSQYLDWLRLFRDGVIRPRGAKLVLLGDAPMLPHAGPTCTSGWDPDPSMCEVALNSSSLLTHRLNDERFLNFSLETSYGQVAACSILERFCQNGVCGAYIPGTTINAYLDRDHLSTAGSRYLWPFIAACMREQGILPDDNTIASQPGCVGCVGKQ